MTRQHAGRNTAWASRTKSLLPSPVPAPPPLPPTSLQVLCPPQSLPLESQQDTQRSSSSSCGAMNHQWAWKECGKSCQIMQLHQSRKSRCVWWHLTLGSQRASNHLIKPSEKIRQLYTDRQFWLQVSQRDEGRGRAERRIKQSINITAQD